MSTVNESLARYDKAARKKQRAEGELAAQMKQLKLLGIENIKAARKRRAQLEKKLDILEEELEEKLAQLREMVGEDD